MKINVDIDGQTYQVEIEDIHSRPVVAIVDGERYEVWPEAEAQTPINTTAKPVIAVPETSGAAASMAQAPSAGKSSDLTAPLPGVIVAILVKPGDTVTRGQEMCTLEAMKMKNAIKSNREGTVASVEISVGDQVNHGQLLMTYKK